MRGTKAEAIEAWNKLSYDKGEITSNVDERKDEIGRFFRELVLALTAAGYPPGDLFIEVAKTRLALTLEAEKELGL